MTEAVCTNCGHAEPHNGPAGDIADACTHPGCNCGYDSRGDTSGGEHVHQFWKWATFHRAPIGPYPEHTSFYVLMCRCGAYETFPRPNFELTTPKFQEFLAAVAALHIVQQRRS